MSVPAIGLAAVALFASALVSVAQPQFPATGPVLPIERKTTEAPRTVAAPNYRDAYCSKWTDGCSSCERATANDEPKCRAISSQTCERKPVECRTLLKTAGRVCLAYRDGCNTCAHGRCTAMACMTTLADGTSKLKDPDYQCDLPRRDRYDSLNQISADLKGHWRLTDPRGRTCEIVNGFLVWLTPACIVLGPPVILIRAARVSGLTLELTPHGGEALLSFDTSNLDDLEGTGSSQGYRLTRLEAQPRDPREWEGSWLLRHDGYACDLFLTMRPQVIGPRPLSDFVQIPSGLSFASNCLSPSVKNKLRITHLDNARPPILMPQWTSWYFEGQQIVFLDDSRHATRFARAADGTWTAEIDQAGYRPIGLRLSQRAK